MQRFVAAQLPHDQMHHISGKAKPFTPDLYASSLANRIDQLFDMDSTHRHVHARPLSIKALIVMKVEAVLETNHFTSSTKRLQTSLS
jgi:hypothetical protein